MAEYQDHAVNKALENDGSLLVAHPMGSGKTKTSVDIVERLRKDGKAKNALVVVPASLRSNYLDNGIKKWSKSSGTILGSITEEHPDIYDKKLPKSDYYVVSYDMFRKDPDLYLDRTGADTIVVDEMHNFRNENTKNYQQMRSVRGRVKNFIGLTGTPFNNHPADVRPLIDIVSNGNHMLGKNEKEFKKRFVASVGDRETLANHKLLGNELNKWMHYVSKDRVNQDVDVPDKVIEDVDVEMSPLQQTHYRYAFRKLPKDVQNKISQGLPINRKEAFHILPMLTMARGVSNSIGYVNSDISPESAAAHTPKIKRAIYDLEEHLNEAPHHRAIVHSHLVQGGVDVMSAGLTARGIKHGVIKGKIPQAERDQLVKDYNKGKLRTLLISSAGTTGLNLPNTTMHLALDGHYNPAVIDQIEARGIRAGSKVDKVLVKRYRSVHTPTLFNRMGLTNKDKSVDEWIYNLANNKNDINNQAEALLKSAAEPIDQLEEDVAGEHDAINLYQKHIDTLKEPKIVKLLRHIQGEEKQHVKELTEAIQERRKTAAEISGYHYTPEGRHPENILNYSESKQREIVTNMKGRHLGYLDNRKLMDSRLYDAAREKLGDKIRTEHPLYFRVGKDPNNWKGGDYTEFKLDSKLLRKATYTLGDSFNSLRSFRRGGIKNLKQELATTTMSYSELKKMDQTEIDAHPNMAEGKGGNYIEGQLWVPWKLEGKTIVEDR